MKGKIRKEILNRALLDAIAGRLDPIPDWVGRENLIPIDDFIDMCHNGVFVDYDGHGIWATVYGMQKDLDEHGRYTDAHVKPSFLISIMTDESVAEKRKHFTHILWFNR